MRFTTWCQTCVWMVEQIIRQLPSFHHSGLYTQTEFWWWVKNSKGSSILFCRSTSLYYSSNGVDRTRCILLKSSQNEARNRSLRRCDHDTQSQWVLCIDMTYISSRKDSACTCISVCLCIFLCLHINVCSCVFMAYFIPVSPMSPPSLIPATSLLSLLVMDPH